MSLRRFRSLRPVPADGPHDDPAAGARGSLDGDDGPGPTGGGGRLNAIDPFAITGWHVAFWLLWSLAVITQLVPDGEGTSSTGVLALLAVLGMTYAATIGHSRERVTGRPAFVYLVVAVLVTGAACALDTQLALLLFLVYPQIWMYSTSLLSGVLFTAALSVSTVVGALWQFGVTEDTVKDWVPNLAASMFFSIMLGIWIDRVIRQSQERASLIAQLEATRAELAAAHHAQGVAAERERMAREIHDTLAQGFTSVVMLAQAARGALPADAAGATEALDRLDAIEEVARENLAEARALVAAFSPVRLDGSTLQDALSRLAERFGRETGIDVRLEVSGDVSGLTPDRQVVLVRAAQEALSNVRQHARATRVVLRLAGDQDGARIEVDDDGVGFDASGSAGAVHAAATGFGLPGMRGRAQEVGGQVDVSSSPGAGTRIVVRVPTRDEAI